MAASSTFPIGRSPFRAKGVLYQGTRTFFDATARGGFASLLEEIREPELRAFIDQPFLPASFYDVMVVPDLLPYEAYALRMGVEPYLLHRVKWQAKRDLDGGVYGWILRLANPATIATRLPKVFGQMYDFGVVEVGEVIDDTTTARMDGVPRVLSAWLSSSIRIYGETALKLAGVKQVRVEAAVEPSAVPGIVPMDRLTFEMSWR